MNPSLGDFSNILTIFEALRRKWTDRVKRTPYSGGLELYTVGARPLGRTSRFTNSKELHDIYDSHVSSQRILVQKQRLGDSRRQCGDALVESRLGLDLGLLHNH